MKSLLICLTIFTSLITHDLFASTHVPAQYRLKNILISVSSQSSSDLSKNYQVSINGNGNSFYIKNNQEKQALTVANETLLELVNDFYTIHFFELKDSYGIKKEVKFKKSDILTTVISNHSLENSKKLCIQLRTFKKCLSTFNDQPVGAVHLIQKIEDLFIPKP